MPYLTADDKAFFRENGYLIKRDVLSQALILATLHEAPVFAMAEEMVGTGQLNPNTGPGPHLVFPSGDPEWKLPGVGHLDGYYTPTNGVPEGTVGVWHICATIYVEEVRPRGAGF